MGLTVFPRAFRAPYERWQRAPLTRRGGDATPQTLTNGGTRTIAAPAASVIGDAPFYYLRVYVINPVSTTDLVAISVNPDNPTSTTSGTPAGGGASELVQVPAGQGVTLYGFSPDGNTITYSWEYVVPTLTDY